MEKNLSLSTVTICIASLENLKSKVDGSIAYHKEYSSQVPTWMLDISRDYEDAIKELVNFIEL